MIHSIDDLTELKDDLIKIYNDLKIKVNNTIIDLPQTTSEASTKIIAMPSQIYQSTSSFSKFDQRWDNYDEASIAYGLAEQGSVILIVQEDSYDDAMWNAPIFVQTLLWPAVQANPQHDLFHTHIFLNFNSEYMPPRPVDVLFMSNDEYRKSNNKSPLLNQVINRASNYDFVLSPETSGMAEDLNRKMQRNQGSVRCVIYY